MVPEAQRASPDALLAVAERERKGHLKIFLGAAPGVGKTYAMLSAARELKNAGRDVVVGLVETHLRKETEALVQGFEILPRKPLAYRNRMVEEFDIDAALKRRPDLLLVDELAHTNATASRHPKRWQDIEELVAAGIDVWTTLNVQHLESLNDVILRITRVRVRETVPDSIFEEADEIVLVDFPPDELLKRLAEGKVYVRDTAVRAVENFFKPQNLTALRELALRRAAERIDADLLERMQAQAIEGPWAAGERILACIGPHPDALSIVRAAKRLADLIDAPWMAVTVERPGNRPDAIGRRHIDEAVNLAQSLGGDARTLTGTDIPGELLRFSKAENVTQIIVGRSRSGFLAELLRRSLPHELVRRAADIAIHVVTGAAAVEVPRARFRMPALHALPFAWSSLAVAGAVALGEGASRLTPVPNVSLIFMTAVLVSAIRFGFWPAAFTSLLSFLAYNFFFIDPLYTFTIAKPYEFFALVLFLAVAVLTSALAGQTRDQANASAERVRATRRLYEFTRRLSGLATLDDIAEGAAGEIHRSLGAAVLVLLPRDGELVLRAAWPPEDDLDTATAMAARWAFEHDEPAGADTATLPSVPWRFVPLRTAEQPLGVVGVARDAEAPAMDSEARALLDTLAEQTAAALQRASLVREIVATRTAAETEQVRNTVLASISHDFRTPLASIVGSASTLIEYGDKFDPKARGDLLSQIKDEAENLDGMVRDLLAVTRIDAHALELRRDWLDLGEVVERVIALARRRGAGQVFEVALPPDLPLVRADATLVEQAIGNVVGNVLVHAGERARVQVGGEVTPDNVTVTITDNGPGIAADLLSRVFDKFVRGGPPASDGNREGTGLGLAIAKGIVEAHGGAIRAESPVEGGRGTRISLGFPRGDKA